jgi:hypothetical protein
MTVIPETKMVLWDVLWIPSNANVNIIPEKDQQGTFIIVKFKKY